MNSSEVKNMLISSLDKDTDSSGFYSKLEEEGISYDFSKNFRNRVVDKLFSAGLKISHEVDFVNYLSFAFYRVALTGVAAIIVLLISIFLMQGSLSFNSFLGLNNTYDESIVCLLTGN